MTIGNKIRQQIRRQFVWMAFSSVLTTPAAGEQRDIESSKTFATAKRRLSLRAIVVTRDAKLARLA